jgi:WD40 repeat protein
MEDPAPNPSSDDADPSPQIQQNLEGNDNQAIVEMKGGTAIGQVLGGLVMYFTITNKYYTVDANPPKIKNKNPQIGANPYQGLSAFQETDGDRFFGRNAEVEDLWNKFFSLHQDGYATRLLTIYGPSGSGKSSLVRAGLIPKLAIKPLSVRESTRVVVMVPGTRPLESLGLVLARIAITNDPSPVKKGAEFKGVLEKKKDGRYEGLCQIANALLKIESQPLIVVVDQLEELFTQCEDPAEREAFIGNLLYATADRSKQVAAIVTLSSDFLGKAQQYFFDKSILKNGLLVMAMDEDGLRKAIEEPAKLEWDPTTLKWKTPEIERYLLDAGTVNLLIEQTKGREGTLPLLQFALQQIWVSLQEGQAPAKTFQAIGGVTGALAEKAQLIYNRLKPAEQEIARRVFLGLVQLGEGVKDTRRRTELSRLISHRDNSDRVRAVIGQFAHPDERLITLSNNGIEETAEVTHEALFDNWKQFEKWLDEGRDDLRLQRRLDEAAMSWQNHGRAEGNLWRPPNLDLLKEYHQRKSIEFSELQLQFLKSSERCENNRKRLNQFGIGGLILGLLFMGYQLRQARKLQVAQLATTAEALITTKPIDAQIDAIAAVELAKSRLLSFPKYSMPPSIRRILLETIRVTREQNRFLENSEVNSVAFSPDGKSIISGYSDHHLRRWNAETGQIISQPWIGHTEKIRSVAFSPDGNRIASGSGDNTIRIWDSNGNLLQSLTGHQKVVSSVAFSLDGNRIVSGSGDNTIRIWDANTGQLLKIFSDRKNVVNSVVFSPDGKRIASGSSDNTVRVWDTNTGKSIGQPFVGHNNAIFAVAFSPDGKRIASGSLDNTVRVWDANTGKSIGQSFVGHDNVVNSVVFSPDGKRIASGSSDNTLRIWDTNTGKSIGQPFVGHNNIVTSVAFSPDGQRIISGSLDKTVRIWDANTPFVGHEFLVFSVAFSPDGESIVSGSRDKTVRIWNKDGHLKQKLSGHTDAVYAVAISHDGERIISGGWNNELLLWNVKTGKLIGEKLIGHNNAVSSVAFSPDSKRFVSGSFDNTIRIWDVNTGQSQKTLINHKNIVLSVAFSPNGKMIVSGSSDSTAMIWETITGKPIFTLKHPGAVKAVAFSPNGEMIVTGGEDNL